MILCPICIPNVYHEAVKRTYRQEIEKVRNELKKYLDKPPLEVYMQTISDQGAVYARLRSPKYNGKRGKRDLISSVVNNLLSEVVQQGVAYFTGNIVSNLITTAIERFNPNSNTNRLTRLESAYEDIKKSVEISRSSDRGILENIEKLSNVVQQTVERINKDVQTFPQYVWLSSLIVQRISQSGRDLQRVADEARRGRLAIEPFARLTGMHELKRFQSQHTRIRSITRLNNHTINIKFDAILESPDTKVYKVHAFDHWDNLDETPKLRKYVGAEYLIFNEKFNCIKALPGAPGRIVGDQCLEQDGEDPALKQ